MLTNNILQTTHSIQLSASTPIPVVDLTLAPFSGSESELQSVLKSVDFILYYDENITSDTGINFWKKISKNLEKVLSISHNQITLLQKSHLIFSGLILSKEIDLNFYAEIYQAVLNFIEQKSESVSEESFGEELDHFLDTYDHQNFKNNYYIAAKILIINLYQNNSWSTTGIGVDADN